MFTNFDDLKGKVFTSVTQIKGYDGDSIVFANDDEEYRLEHHQDCCESVYIEDVTGDLSDLQDTPILVVEELGDSKEESKYGDVETWTFYEFRTIKGSVTIRWYGTSNGYYSTEAYLYKTK